MLPSFAVQFQNRLAGSCRLAGAPEQEQRTLQAEITGRIDSPMQAFFGARVPLSGTISVGGLGDGQPLSGEIELVPLRSVRLVLTFADEAGQSWRIEAAKEFQMSDALRGRTELTGQIRRDESGAEAGAVRLEVDLLASFGQFWGSLRPAQ